MHAMPSREVSLHSHIARLVGFIACAALFDLRLHAETQAVTFVSGHTGMFRLPVHDHICYARKVYNIFSAINTGANVSSTTRMHCNQPSKHGCLTACLACILNTISLVCDVGKQMQ